MANCAELSSEYTCPICLDILKTPVIISCGNNHVYCKACLEEYAEVSDPKCAECREEFNPRHTTPAEDLIIKMKTTNTVCSWCEEQMLISKLRNHLAKCSKADRSIPKFKPIGETSQCIPSDVPNRSTFTCPYCQLRNLDIHGLRNHCNQEHATNTAAVVCPVCSSMPWGDGNLKSADFNSHLNTRHRFEYDTYVDYQQDDDEMLQAAIRASLDQC
ncbi:hypothetical protein CHS0354_031023 [Potamilus streckersoni]|uniref:RING-type domain-containing protein n=1 Tax=Potamilus streckersoni TaxID=2493646 RepID=A0AAE0TCW4_9BIVA|nr:hypothetical protein CHS0354_031023 [Potamilus streckersoni]